MLDRRKANHPVHIPSKEDKFEFDAEVATIFPDMAKRSIPNYELFHRVHAGIVAKWFKTTDITMLDVGASHGAFYTALAPHYPHLHRIDLPMPKLFAIDQSPQMCDAMRVKMPHVHVRCGGVDSPDFMNDTTQYDVINCTYLLQFLIPQNQLPVLYKLMSMVKPGGLLILGQKELHHGALGDALHEEYVEWRMANGYTRAEIEAKTRALKGSMWPMDSKTTQRALELQFREVTETTRSFMFSTLIAYK